MKILNSAIYSNKSKDNHIIKIYYLVTNKLILRKKSIKKSNQLYSIFKSS